MISSLTSSLPAGWMGRSRTRSRSLEHLDRSEPASKRAAHLESTRPVLLPNLVVISSNRTQAAHFWFTSGIAADCPASTHRISRLCRHIADIQEVYGGYKADI